MARLTTIEADYLWKFLSSSNLVFRRSFCMLLLHPLPLIHLHWLSVLPTMLPLLGLVEVLWRPSPASGELSPMASPHHVASVWAG